MHAPWSAGTGWPVSRQNSAIFSGMSSGLKKRGSLGLMSETNGGAAAASCSSVAKSYWFPCLRPMPAAFLHEPEADDVFEQAHGVAETDFVGETEVAALVGDDGLRPFDAHERPGAGTEVGPVLAARRDGGDRRAGVVRTGGDDFDLRQAGFGRRDFFSAGRAACRTGRWARTIPRASRARRNSFFDHVRVCGL